MLITAETYNKGHHQPTTVFLHHAVDLIHTEVPIANQYQVIALPMGTVTIRAGHLLTPVTHAVPRAAAFHTAAAVSVVAADIAPAAVAADHINPFTFYLNNQMYI
jgi:hypothetical protein